MSGAPQTIYARWLGWGTRAAVAALCAGLLAYVSGWLEPLVPLEQLPLLWGEPVARYVLLTAAPTGWGWLATLGRGDYLNLLGVALLSAVTPVCFARILPLLYQRGEPVQCAIAAAQLAVLVAAAASGLLGSAH